MSRGTRTSGHSGHLPAAAEQALSGRRCSDAQVVLSGPEGSANCLRQGRDHHALCGEGDHNGADAVCGRSVGDGLVGRVQEPSSGGASRGQRRGSKAR